MLTSRLAVGYESDDSEELLYQEAMRELRAPTRAGGTSLVYVALFVVFIVGQLSELKSVSGVAILVAVLLFHEAGHALGMRLFGFRDVRMFFIPFLGAAVSGRARGASATKEALVSLLGPLPGIVLAVSALLVVAWFPNPLVATVARVTLLLNAFNLLPFGALDGGRFLQRVVFSRHRVLELLFMAGGSLLLAWIAWQGSLKILVVFALLGLLALPTHWRVLKAAGLLRQAFPTMARDPERLSDVEASWLFNAARSLLTGTARHQGAPIARLMESMLEATKPPPGALATVGLLGLYVFAVVSCLVGFGAMLATAR